MLLQRRILRNLTYQTPFASIRQTLLSPNILRSMMCYRLWLVDFKIEDFKIKEKFFCQGFVCNSYLSNIFRYRKNKMLTNTFVEHFQGQQADRQQIPTNQQLGVSMYYSKSKITNQIALSKIFLECFSRAFHDLYCRTI